MTDLHLAGLVAHESDPDVVKALQELQTLREIPNDCLCTCPCCSGVWEAFGAVPPRDMSDEELERAKSECRS